MLCYTVFILLALILNTVFPTRDRGQTRISIGLVLNILALLFVPSVRLFLVQALSKVQVDHALIEDDRGTPLTFLLLLLGGAVIGIGDGLATGSALGLALYLPSQIYQALLIHLNPEEPAPGGREWIWVRGAVDCFFESGDQGRLPEHDRWPSLQRLRVFLIFCFDLHRLPGSSEMDHRPPSSLPRPGRRISDAVAGAPASDSEAERLLGDRSEERIRQSHQEASMRGVRPVADKLHHHHDLPRRPL